MKIKSIKAIGKKPVYDISVKDAEHYILENGVVTHNTGITYSADTIIIFGRQQEKDGTDLAGWNFILNVEKSRFAKEKSKIPLTVLFDSGINKYSGLMDLAIESGDVVKPKNGKYALVNKETGEIGPEVKFPKTQNEEFLGAVLLRPSFRQFVKDKYKLQGGDQSISDDDLDAFADDETDDE